MGANILNIKDVFEWFGFDWNVLKKLNIGPLIFFITLFLILIIIAPLILHLIYGIWNIPNINNAVEENEAIRNLGLMVAALIGVPFLIWRTSVAQKQVNISEQGQITDRINKAVEGLGAEKTIKIIDETQRYQRKNDDWMRDDDNEPIPAKRPDGKPIIDRLTYEKTTPNLEVRIGSIFALERIAQDSPRDHIQIMETLCAYIRENAPCENLQPTENLENRPTVRNDIQVAINVIARRTEEQISQENEKKFRLDLRDTNLSGVNFRKGNFSAAMFHKSKLEGAFFAGCKLHGTQFFYSILNYANFYNSELTGTRFDFSILNKPEIPLGAMSGSITMANIYGTSFIGADISGINYLGMPTETNTTFGSKDTILHEQLDFERLTYEGKHNKIREYLKNENHTEADITIQELEKNNFVYWCPFNSSDLALNSYHTKLLEKLNLDKWPYTS